MSGKPPAQLFGDFKAYSLRSLRVIRPQVHVDEAPGPLFSNLRAQPIHLIVVASDANHVRAENLVPRIFAGSRSDGNEYPRLQPQSRRMRRNRIGQVAGRRTRDRIEAETLRLRQRHGHHAVLKAQRGQADGVILDVEILCRGLRFVLLPASRSAQTRRLE